MSRAFPRSSLTTIILQWELGQELVISKDQDCWLATSKRHIIILQLWMVCLLQCAVADTCHMFTDYSSSSSSIADLWIWETQLAADSSGQSSHIWFAIRILQKEENSSSSSALDLALCQAAYNQVHTCCFINGVTAGGETTVGDWFLFSMNLIELLL